MSERAEPRRRRRRKSRAGHTHPQAQKIPKPPALTKKNTHETTAFLKKIEDTLLSQVALQGVADIKKVFIRETERLVPDAQAQGGYAKESEWMLDTEGVNLLEVLCHPDVDATRTISNHLVEVIDVLGIEAGRGALLKEVRGVIEFDGEKCFFFFDGF